MSRFVWWSATFYEKQYGHFDKMLDVVKEWGYQDEVCPTTSRKHRQGWLHTKQQTLKALAHKLKGVHLEPIPTTETERIKKLKAYCSKEKTRDATGEVVLEKANPNFLTTQQVYELLAKHTQGYITVERLQASKKIFQDEYWYGVASIIFENPALVGYYASPNVLRVWVETRHVWHCKFTQAAQQSPTPSGVREISQEYV